MSFLNDVAGFFADIWDDIKDMFSDVEKDIVAFFSAAIHDASRQLGQAGVKIVQNAVAAAEKAGGTGQEKLAAAFAAVTAGLATEGITAATHVINVAIEAAVAQQKANDAAEEAEKAAAQPKADA